MHRAYLLLGLLFALPVAGAGEPALTVGEAAQHVGARATVCGVIAGAHYAANSKRQPTFINLDKPYPDPVFTVVIWGDYRDRFKPPPETWRGRVCVTGVISAYRGRPEMKVISPAQVRR